MSANHIYPFKGRRLDRSRPVHLYRNLNARQDAKRRYSLRQDGFVVGHTDQLLLRDCRFIVQEAGRRRAIETRKRNVHAYIRGLVTARAKGIDIANGDLTVRVQYHHSLPGFIKRCMGAIMGIEAAPFVLVNRFGVTAL